MKKTRNILDKLMDVVEIWIPSAMMLALFLAFLIQIASRYLFNRPLVWPYELSQLAYLWVITLGCNYAQRTDENIVFSVVYDLVPVTVQKIFDLISSLLVSGIFLVVLPKEEMPYEFQYDDRPAAFGDLLHCAYAHRHRPFGYFLYLFTADGHGSQHHCRDLLQQDVQ